MTLNIRKNMISSLHAAFTDGIGISISNSELSAFDFSRDMIFPQLF